MVGRASKAISVMTELPPSAVRLTDRFFYFDPDHGAHVSRQWAAGAIVTDPEAIAFLMQHNASTEPVDVDPNSTSPI
jgi:hypothetical protein